MKLRRPTFSILILLIVIAICAIGFAWVTSQVTDGTKVLGKSMDWKVVQRTNLPNYENLRAQGFSGLGEIKTLEFPREKPFESKTIELIHRLIRNFDGSQSLGYRLSLYPYFYQNEGVQYLQLQNNYNGGHSEGSFAMVKMNAEPDGSVVHFEFCEVLLSKFQELKFSVRFRDDGEVELLDEAF